MPALKVLFVFITEQFFFFDNVLYNYFAMSIVLYIAYKIAFSTVGKMYRLDLINGKFAGSLFHWIIRLIVFVSLFLLVSFAIWIVKLVIAVPTWIWFTLLPIGLISLITYTVRRIYIGRRESEQLKKQTADLEGIKVWTNLNVTEKDEGECLNGN